MQRPSYQDYMPSGLVDHEWMRVKTAKGFQHSVFGFSPGWYTYWRLYWFRGVKAPIQAEVWFLEETEDSPSWAEAVIHGHQSKPYRRVYPVEGWRLKPEDAFGQIERRLLRRWRQVEKKTDA